MTQIQDVISYDEGFMSLEEANDLFDHLMGYSELIGMLEIDTSTGDSFSFNFGKLMFLDKALKEENKFSESIWGKNVVWSDKMRSLKSRVENVTKNEFSTCVCIYYPDGNSGVDYHSDSVAFGDTSIIPSISLGEERIFGFREKTSLVENTMVLKHGSLLIMGNGCQEFFEHSLPLSTKYKNPRISLTFRKFGFDDKK